MKTTLKIGAAFLVSIAGTQSIAATLDGSAAVSEFRVSTIFGDPIAPNTIQNVNSFSQSDSTPIAEYSINADIQNGSLSHSITARNNGNTETQFGGTQFVDLSYSYYDFLTFSNTADVTFQLSFDGVHTIFGTEGSIGSSAQFRLFDITNLTGNALIEESFGLTFSSEITGVDVIASNGIGGEAFIVTDLFQGGNPSFDVNLADVELDGSGEAASFDETVTETASVEAGRAYLAVYGISSVAALRNEETFATADFLNTASLGIIDFGGTTVSSASGQFLTNSSVTTPQVPVPAAFPLLATGLFILSMMKRRCKTV